MNYNLKLKIDNYKYVDLWVKDGTKGAKVRKKRKESECRKLENMNRGGVMGVAGRHERMVDEGKEERKGSNKDVCEEERILM